MSEKQILLTPKQAKDILGVGRQEMYNLCKTKGFPSFIVSTTPLSLVLIVVFSSTCFFRIFLFNAMLYCPPISIVYLLSLVHHILLH